MSRPEPSAVWRTVDVDGAQVEFVEIGEGDPLLFLHGWGMTPRIYLPAVRRLCSAGVRVIAPSLPGFGHSDGPARSELALPWYADRIARLLDTIELEKPAFVMGHSFGGGVAIQLATDHGEYLRSLTLLNTVGGSPGDSNSLGLGHRPWWQWAIAALAEASPHELIRLHPSVVRDLGIGIVRDFVPNAVRRPLTMLRSVLLALTVDLADQAQQLVDAGLPVLFVWGDRDRLITPGAFAAIESRMPPEIVAGRHGWVLTDPDAFGQLLHNALVVHALLERKQRGQAVRMPYGEELAEFFPPERRHRRRTGLTVVREHEADA